MKGSQTVKSQKSKKEKTIEVHSDGFTVNGCRFHVDPKYQPIGQIGQGSYGVVCSAKNKETNQRVAIKKIKPMAGDEWDATHTLREIRLLRCLDDHENVISLVDMSAYEQNDELYLMLDLVDTDLHKLIQSPTKLSDDHVRVIMYQILSGVKALHENNILHRDLKPGNLLINKDCEVKITDFGLARRIPKGSKSYRANMNHKDGDTPATSSSVMMTEYVITRWYRPPELMLSPNGEYTGAVDMWSVGCIMGELLTRKPLFPGQDFLDQLRRVFQLVPVPPIEDRGYEIDKDALQFLQSLPPTPKDPLGKYIANKLGGGKVHSEAIDLLSKLLEFNPEKRLSVDEALNHPYMQSVKRDWGEIDSLALNIDKEFEFEESKEDLSTLRQFIRDEVLLLKGRSLLQPENFRSEKNKEQMSYNHDPAIKSELEGFTIDSCDFHVPSCYSPVGAIGEGTYGVVCSAKMASASGRSSKGEFVAIKKISPLASDEWDARHALREIRLMRHFGSHPNIVQLKNLHLVEERDELYMAMELADTDLHKLIHSSTRLEPHHIQAIMYQLISGLEALHSNNVIHRDLKPGNVLINKSCEVKIADFGLARALPRKRTIKEDHGDGPDEKLNNMTDYVVTRWYRSPEVMLSKSLSHQPYSQAIDMWSVGCIFAELIHRKALFPGKGFLDQITQIFTLIPFPTTRIEEKCGYAIDDDALSYLKSLPVPNGEKFSTKFADGSPEAISLLRRLFCINPKLRITASQALRHPYFRSLRKEFGLPQAFRVSNAFDLGFDDGNFNLEDLKGLLKDEVKSFNASQEKERKNFTPCDEGLVKLSPHKKGNHLEERPASCSPDPSISSYSEEELATVERTHKNDGHLESTQAYLNSSDHTDNEIVSDCSDVLLDEDSDSEEKRELHENRIRSNGKKALDAIERKNCSAKNTKNRSSSDIPSDEENGKNQTNNRDLLISSRLKTGSSKSKSVLCGDSRGKNNSQDPLRTSKLKTRSDGASMAVASKGLPLDWEKRIDSTTGRYYYFNMTTRKKYARLPSTVSQRMISCSNSKC